MCFKLPSNVSTLEGALCEPLSVGLYAVEKSAAKLGQSAVIFGAGCIGLVTMLVLKAIGVSDITVVDIVQKRLDTALALGAKRVIRGDQEDAVVALMKTGGCDVVFDAAGSPRTALQATQVVARNGVVVIVAWPPIRSSAWISEPWPRGKRASRPFSATATITRPPSRRSSPVSIPLKKIASHVFPFEKIVESVLFNMDNPNEVVKGVISFV